MGRVLPGGASSAARAGRWARRDAVASAAALAALFNGAACSSGNGSAGRATSSQAPLPVPSTPDPSTSAPETTPSTPPPPSTPATSPTTAPGTTFRRVTSTTPEREPATTTATTTPSSTTPSTNNGYCYVQPNGTTSCAVPGRPLRRRRRLLLPATGGADRPDDDARAEYASVASFGELALRLLAVGAPPDLVAACHRAALDEIRHASTCERLAGRLPSSFGAISGLLGRRLGGWRRSRRFQLQRLAVESLVDGWRNEGAAAAQLRDRAETAASPQDRAALMSMADDEQRHADLARAIVTWCFDEEPVAVGRALARAAPIASAA